MNSIAIAGASLAGLRAAEALRRLGYSGRIAMVGAEPHLPYDRPPLSKEVLTGKWGPERTALRTQAGSAEDLALDWRLGVRATALDLGARELALSDGSRLRFDGLVIATGAAPRALRGQPPLAGVHTLRTLEDALAIRAALERSPRVAVVGAGFIGAEVAASCRARGLEVVVLEALPAPLSRAFGAEMGGLIAALHRDHGVDLRTGVGVAALEGAGRVERVRLTDGTSVAADLVVVGIGVSPATAWLEGSGLRIDDGVVCDSTCTAAPGVVAAGDVARWTNSLFDGESMRVEHWTNAVEQGAAAAAALLAGPGAAEPFANAPFFWSDQHGVKIQLAGRAALGDEMRVVDGSLAERRFVALYGRRGRLVGALAWSRPRLAIAYRSLIEKRASWEDALAFQP